jgi:iron-sulfur cluster assembly accessory protein
MATINLTEKAAGAVKRIMEETLQSEATRAAGSGGGTATATATETAVKKLYLRVRVVGGGCSGFQNKLDLDPEINEKLDEVFEFHGIPVAIDKRSLMYLDGVQIDYHDDMNRTGFSITNPNAKSTCGCGSSYSM